MTLDRDAARALFDNAPAPTASMGGSTPFAVASPFGQTEESFDARTSGRARKGPDWRLMAPVGVAALCAVAVLVVAQTNNDEAEPGKTVASSPMAPLNPPPALPAPIETAQVAAPPAASIVEPTRIAPTPVVKATVRATPARRAAPPRAVATAPSATDSAANVVAHEPEPYMATPSVVVPAPTPTPATPSAAPPPVITPEPPIVPEPTPDQVIPPQG